MDECDQVVTYTRVVGHFPQQVWVAAVLPQPHQDGQHVGVIGHDRPFSYISAQPETQPIQDCPSTAKQPHYRVVLVHSGADLPMVSLPSLRASSYCSLSARLSSTCSTNTVFSGRTTRGRPFTSLLLVRRRVMHLTRVWRFLGTAPQRSQNQQEASV